MRFKEKLVYIALGGILMVIGQLLLQSGIWSLPLVQAQNRTDSEVKPAWTQEQFVDWYRRFIKIRNETHGVNLSRVDFSKFQRIVEDDVHGNYMVGVDLQGSDLGYSNLEGADLRLAKLDGASLYAANLRGVDFRKATLRRSHCDMATFSGANLQEANLYRARLAGADFEMTNFQKAYLRGADLVNANLRGANLYGAELKGAELKGAYYNDATKFPEDFDPIIAGMVMTGLIDPIR